MLFFIIKRITTFHRIQGNCDHMLAECVILTEITVAASFIRTMRGNEYVILMSAMHCCGITDFIGFEIRYFPVFVERKSAPLCWRVGRKLYLVKPMGWHGGSEASWSWQRRRAVMHFLLF